MTFQNLPLHERITKAVADAGYTQPTPIQAAAIPKITKGADVIGIAQTGTGKTAAFTLPLLSALVASTENSEPRHTRALIIAPTRELVQQIHDNIRSYAKYTNLRTAAIFGGITDKGQINKLESEPDIVIATPGRLLDLCERGHAKLSHVTTLILDEADRMLDMGFIPDIRAVVKKLSNSRQTLLFSATFSKQIEALTKEFLNSPSLVEVERRASPAETIEQNVYPISEALKIPLLLHLLESSHEFYSVIVFARTRQGADHLHTVLKEHGVASSLIHGDRSQGQRRRAIKDFTEGKIRLLIATDVAARGIDIDGVTHVINLDFPEHPEDYIHRIGRTGRAGTEGQALTFVTPANTAALSKVERLIRKTLPKIMLRGFDYQQEPDADMALPAAPAPDPRKKSRHATPSKFSHKNKSFAKKTGKRRPPRRK